MPTATPAPPLLHSFPDSFRGLVLGASGGIGQAFVQALQAHPRCAVVLALLSAKVGSIGDNRLGGWYSYRASKAALNMLVKTAAIEVARSNPQAVLASLHPGTVNTALSQPFRGEQIGRAPADAVHDMLAVLDGLRPGDSGGFYAYSGAPLPW